MIVEIVRYAYLTDCTLGTLQAGALRLATIERPWLPNPDGQGGLLSRSCVPDGTYELRPHDSERFPGTYALVNETLGVYYQTRPAGQTWGRTAILIHVGNRVKDVIGCVAVGLEHGELYGSRAVLSSRQAMEQLRGMLGRNYHELVIRPTRGTSEEPA